jgi:hypothetical protein
LAILTKCISLFVVVVNNVDEEIVTRPIIKKEFRSVVGLPNVLVCQTASGRVATAWKLESVLHFDSQDSLHHARGTQSPPIGGHFEKASVCPELIQHVPQWSAVWAFLAVSIISAHFLAPAIPNGGPKQLRCRHQSWIAIDSVN